MLSLKKKILKKKRNKHWIKRSSKYWRKNYSKKEAKNKSKNAHENIGKINELEFDVFSKMYQGLNNSIFTKNKESR